MTSGVRGVSEECRWGKMTSEGRRATRMAIVYSVFWTEVSAECDEVSESASMAAMRTEVLLLNMFLGIHSSRKMWISSSPGNPPKQNQCAPNGSFQSSDTPMFLFPGVFARESDSQKARDRKKDKT